MLFQRDKYIQIHQGGYTTWTFPIATIKYTQMIKRGRPFLTYGSTRIIDNGVKVTQEGAVYVVCVCKKEITVVVEDNQNWVLSVFLKSERILFFNCFIFFKRQRKSCSENSRCAFLIISFFLFTISIASSIAFLYLSFKFIYLVCNLFT